jgi:hypothetical protein
MRRNHPQVLDGLVELDRRFASGGMRPPIRAALIRF